MEDEHEKGRKNKIDKEKNTGSSDAGIWLKGIASKIVEAGFCGMTF